VADEHPLLSNIRDYLGWVINRRVVDVTAGDPPSLPDSHGDGDGNFVVLHFDNGGTLNVPIDSGFHYDNPVSSAADRGELCAECMSGKRHLDPPKRESISDELTAIVAQARASSTSRPARAPLATAGIRCSPQRRGSTAPTTASSRPTCTTGTTRSCHIIRS
jgi:hypothetical protein